MIKLTSRMLEIAKFTMPPIAEHMPSVVCDVGTDHGHIPIYLAQSGVNRIVATDISSGSAEKAHINIVRYGLEGHIEVRIGNGLEVLAPNEAEAVIIAGMGGILISEIMSAGIKGAKSFVLQPMAAVYELRKWLYENGYYISHEALVAEKDKIYNIIRAIKGEAERQTLAELYVGKKLLEQRHPLLPELLAREAYLLDRKINGLARTEQGADEMLVLLRKQLLEWRDEFGNDK